jgi:hypothetical protein
MVQVVSDMTVDAVCECLADTPALTRSCARVHPSFAREKYRRTTIIITLLTNHTLDNRAQDGRTCAAVTSRTQNTQQKCIAWLGSPPGDIRCIQCWPESGWVRTAHGINIYDCIGRWCSRATKHASTACVAVRSCRVPRGDGQSTDLCDIVPFGAHHPRLCARWDVLHRKQARAAHRAFLHLECHEVWHDGWSCVGRARVRGGGGGRYGWAMCKVQQ